MACAAMLAVAVCPLVTWFWLACSPISLRMIWAISSASSQWVQSHFAAISFCWLSRITLFSVRPIVGWWSQWRFSQLDTLEHPERLVSAWERASDRVGIHRIPELKLVAAPVGPMVTGWLQPIVLVPVSIAARRELTRLRGGQLRLDREQASLFEKERLLIERLTNGFKPMVNGVKPPSKKWPRDRRSMSTDARPSTLFCRVRKDAFNPSWTVFVHSPNMPNQRTTFPILTGVCWRV